MVIMAQSITHDSFLWYGEGTKFASLGLAVPNYGNDTHSKNSTIHQLVDLLGANLQAMMLDDDVLRVNPPTINTLVKVHRLCIRARQILAARERPHDVPELQVEHTNPALEPFRLFPTPYFGSHVRNPYLKRWAMWMLTALTEATQHTENSRATEVTVDFSQSIGKWVAQVYKELAVEVLLIPRAEAEAEGFTLTEAHFKAYDPTKFYTSREATQTVPSYSVRFTEDELSVITSGILTSHMPELKPYPGHGPEGIDTTKIPEATGQDPTNSAFSTPGLNI